MRVPRRTAAFGVSASVLALVFIVALPEVASADSGMWTSDADWRSGTIDRNLALRGTGSPAYLELGPGANPEWMRMAPATVPGAREAYCLEWIDVDDTFLLFGGTGSTGLLGDTWAYSLSTDSWTELVTGAHPSNRSMAGCAYDPDRNVVVLFGGWSGSAWSSDTWEFDATTRMWAEVLPMVSPSGLDSVPMTFDARQGKVILVGRNATTLQMETWAYDAAADSWEDRAPAGSPGSRTGHAITFDPFLNRTLLLFGANGTELLRDFWAYDYMTNVWMGRQLLPGDEPNPRIGADMVPRNDCVLVFGGFDGIGYPPETWCFYSAISVWFRFNVTSPGGRTNIQLAHSAEDNASVVFGGEFGAPRNDTWALGRGYIANVDAVWTSSAEPEDTYCSLVRYGEVWWNRTAQPQGATVRLQVATSNSASGPWTFIGPGGFPGSYYTVPGTEIDPRHDGQRYLRVQAKLKTSNARVTPVLEDLTVTWAGCSEPPFISGTAPGNGSRNVSVGTPIWVNFSEPMNASSVTWTISGGVAATWAWFRTNRTLELTPLERLSDCTNYTVEITSGRDANDDLPLIPGPAPNPFTFRTACVRPFIVSTDPPDDGLGVPLDHTILVTFSEAMNASTVAWAWSGGEVLTGSWSPERDVLSLNHSTPFLECTAYALHVLSGKDDQALDIAPGPAPNPWTFFTACPSPYIVSTTPAHGGVDVLLDGPITVAFSEAMDTGSVTWNISDPAVSWGPADWTAGNTTVTLPHSQFSQGTTYALEITAGTDPDGNPLAPALARNPWSFVTIDYPPYITCEYPPDGAVDVPLDTSIIVCFSEPMDTATVTWSISPPTPMTATWSPADTNLTLVSATPLLPCTVYRIELTRVAPGPFPNPWSFRTVCPIGPPSGLSLYELPPDAILLTWGTVPYAVSYRVYASVDRFAASPSAWTLLGETNGTQYAAVGDLTACSGRYYLVRAWDGYREGPNSTMGAKACLAFGHSAATTNIAWFSLPYRSRYLRASDIAGRLGSPNIDVVGKWDGDAQRAIIYYYARGGWQGTDFTIAPGDGLFVGTRNAFQWIVVGTDRDANLTFARNPPPLGSVFWPGLPYTGVYRMASDVAAELGPSRIVEVGLWNATRQTVERWVWDGTSWSGTDFWIDPGAGVYVVVASSFVWRPALITPYVP